MSDDTDTGAAAPDGEEAESTLFPGPEDHAGSEPEEFAGWGTVENMGSLGNEPIEVTHLDTSAQHKLGEWASTAICGNDITSSCLYVAALSSIAAGPYAFICLAAVAAMLYLFRNIYAEVGFSKFDGSDTGSYVKTGAVIDF